MNYICFVMFVTLLGLKIFVTNIFYMDLIDRLKYLMKLNNLSSSAFADEIGVQRSSISHVLSGRNKPSLEFVLKVLSRYPKVSADWLISGKTKSNEMDYIKEPTKEVKTKSEPLPRPTEKITTTNSEKKIKKIVIFYDDNTFDEVLKN